MHYLMTIIEMKRIETTIILIVLTVCCVLTVSASSGKLYTSSYMSSGLVTCITQDKNGFLWVGTMNGLNRFDGYRFNIYTHDSDNSRSIIHNTISYIYASAHGDVWVGTACGLSRYDAAADDFESIPLSEDTTAKPRITAIAETKDGTLYVGTQGFGLYEIKSGTRSAKQTSRFAYGGNDNYYSCIFIDSKQRFWTADNNGAVTCFDTKGKKPRAVLHQAMGIGSVMSFVEDADGSIVMACQHGIMRYNGHSIEREGLASISNTYNAAILSSDKEVLLGSNGSGVLRLSRQGKTQTLQLLNDNIDLSSVNATAILKTVATISGLVAPNEAWLLFRQVSRRLSFCPYRGST